MVLVPSGILIEGLNKTTREALYWRSELVKTKYVTVSGSGCLHGT